MTYGRKHVWLGDRCTRCAMKSDWEGAKHPCEGVGTPLEIAKAQKAVRDKRRNVQRDRLAQKRSAS